MKQANQTSAVVLRQAIVAAAALTVFGATQAFAASANWNAAPTNGNWITAPGENNWSTGDGTFPGSITTPNSTDLATFNVDSPVNTIAINSTAGYTGPLYVASIAFTGPALTTNYTVGSTTGNPIVVTSNPDQGSTLYQSYISGFGRNGATVGVTETINAPIVIPPLTAGGNGFYAFQNNSSIVGDTLVFNGAVSGGATTGTITLTLRGASNSAGNTVNGNISNGQAAALNIFKNDGGTWKLAGNNTYTGGTTVSGGTLVLSGTNNLNPAASGTNAIIVSGGATLSVSNIANNLGGATRVNLGGGSNTGRLVYTGTGETTALVIGSTAFNAGTGLILNQSGTGVLRFTSNLAQTPVAQTITFQGSTAGSGDFAGQITDGGEATPLSVAKSGSGTWALSNATNGYNGTTTIGGGAIEVNTLTNGGSQSGIGASSNAASRLVLTGGALRYVGAATITDRSFSIGVPGGALDSSGTGEVVFNNPAANVALDAPTTATFATTSNAITLPAGTIGGVAVGQTIAGAGIPDGATITGINYSNNTVTISANTTAAGAAGTPITVGAAPVRTLTLTGTNTGNNAVDGAIANAATGGVVGVAKTGNGTWTLRGSNTYTGPTTVTGGRLVVNPAARGPLLSGAGGVNLGNGNGTLVLDYTGGASPLATVKSILTSEYTTATANLTQPFLSGQIRSTAITAGRLIGYADNGTSVTLRVTLGGDADLDGGVSINDFNALAANFGQATGRVWADGDFDYDGGVSINDFNLLAAGFGQSVPATSELWAGLLAFAAAHNDLAAFEAVTGVPEPTSLGLLAVGAVAGLRRRSRDRS